MTVNDWMARWHGVVARGYLAVSRAANRVARRTGYWGRETAAEAARHRRLSRHLRRGRLSYRFDPWPNIVPGDRAQPLDGTPTDAGRLTYPRLVGQFDPANVIIERDRWRWSQLPEAWNE